MLTTDLYPTPVHDAVEALFRALGQPRRSPSEVETPERPADTATHPVFGLSRHFRGFDKGDLGFTDNPYRGDHLSIPCFDEDGDVFVVEMSFHKGATLIERVDFPDGPQHVRAALRGLLDSYETR